MLRIYLRKGDPLKKQKKTINKQVQENFYTIIVFLVLFFTIVLIISLFYPISTEGLPDNAEALSLLKAGIDQRTIIIRSISSIISGISVMIAFISIMQNRQSEIKNERLQVKPFPAYSIPVKRIDYSTSMNLSLLKEAPHTDVITKNDFEISIKNIGLGSLVDYEIVDVHLKDVSTEEQYFNVSSSSNFTLGKEEYGKIGFNMITSFQTSEGIQPENLEQISISCSFKDLLGNVYIQEFTIQSEVELAKKRYVPARSGIRKTRKEYSLTPIRISHNPPELLSTP